MWIAITIGILLAAFVLRDVIQKKHTIQRNFPIVGHFRYWLESIGPELRQYIVSDNNEEKPFSRAQRRWVYASSKKDNNYFGFGTDNDLEQSPNFVVIKHSNFPRHHPLPGDEEYNEQHEVACLKVLGEHRDRSKSFRPRSLVNISAMSFGSLSGPAIEALNRGAQLAGCLHNTGEGGVSSYHRCGGELIMQLGTAYFGCRDADGRFSLPRLVDLVAANPIRAIEIKLSQGAKPGVGGMLPAAKITPEIARVRGIPQDRDCASPAAHSEFHDVDSLLDFVERLDG